MNFPKVPFNSKEVLRKLRRPYLIRKRFVAFGLLFLEKAEYKKNPDQLFANRDSFPVL